jgi:hypothetical protein
MEVVTPLGPCFLTRESNASYLNCVVPAGVVIERGRSKLVYVYCRLSPSINRPRAS